MAAISANGHQSHNTKGGEEHKMAQGPFFEVEPASYALAETAESIGAGLRVKKIGKRFGGGGGITPESDPALIESEEYLHRV
jgi:hypothetical protein